MLAKLRSRLYWIGRTLIIWISEVLGLALMAWLLTGIRVDSWGQAFLFIAVVSLLNAIMWPILSRLTLRFIVYTFGFGALLFNAFVLWLGSQFVPGVGFRGLGVLILAALGITAVNTLFSLALSIDDEASYYRHTLQRHLKNVRGTPLSKYPGVIFLEIDGLSEPDLRYAIKEGYMPNLTRWLKSGSHNLMSWETDTSSQTGACQGAILHGNNNNMPAFRWVEKKDDNRLISCSNAGNVMEIEKNISDGNGLLSANGFSRVNMFSGDAKDNILTVGRMTSLSKVYTPFYYIYFSNPYNVSRTIVLFIAEIFREYGSRLRQKFKGVWPRFGGEKRGGLFPLKRATLCVYLRDIITYTLAGDIYLGEADAIYATYASHDELSHYCGTEDKDTMNGLTKLDRAFGRLERAAQESERPYKFVILSDHGQTKGATFKQRYHMTLEELVHGLLPSEVTIHSRLDANEGWDRVSATLTDVTQNDERFTGKVTRRVTRKRLEEGQIAVGPAYHRLKQERKGKTIPVDEAQVVVLASGNLGLIYFNDWPERMSYEQINQAFPDLIPGLLNHEGIGFILVKSEKDGGIVLGKNGRCYLNNDHVEGENPLANFGPRATHHLRRTNSFQNVSDILVNSFYDPEKDEGAAFEEQIGFHGGMGGHQNKGLLLYPTEWTLNKEEIVGAEHLHRVLKRQLKTIQNTMNT